MALLVDFLAIRLCTRRSCACRVRGRKPERSRPFHLDRRRGHLFSPPHSLCSACSAVLDTDALADSVRRAAASARRVPRLLTVACSCFNRLTSLWLHHKTPALASWPTRVAVLLSNVAMQASRQRARSRTRCNKSRWTVAWVLLASPSARSRAAAYRHLDTVLRRHRSNVKLVIPHTATGLNSRPESCGEGDWRILALLRELIDHAAATRTF